MSEHSENQVEGQEKEEVEQQDPEYQLDPSVRRKQQQQVQQGIFSSLLQNNLSKFCRVFDGTSYAYTKLDLTNKRLFGILSLISSYKHLREITLRHNFLSEFDNLLYLKYLVSLDLSNNRIEDIRSLDNAEILPFLSELDLSHNKIKRLVNIPLPRLQILVLSNNEIHQIEFEGNNTLERIDLKNNKLRDISKLSGLSKLKWLDLSQNLIDDISTLSQLPELQTLLLVKNRIEVIGERMKGVGNLHELDLRQNRLGKIKSLEGVNQNVRVLNVGQNPISEEFGESVRKQIWMLYRFYSKINDGEIEVEEKLDWEKEYKDRKEEERQREEQERLEQEEREREEREKQQAEREEREAREKERLQEEKQKEEERLEEERKAKEEQEETSKQNQQGDGGKSLENPDEQQDEEDS